MNKKHCVKAILRSLLFGVIAFILMLMVVFDVLPGSPCFFDTGRERRSKAKANIHSVQLAPEDFAIRTHGVYPRDSTSATPEDLTLRAFFPSGEYPENPYTGKPIVIGWNSGPLGPGQIGIHPADSCFYIVKGHDTFGVMPLELSPDM